MGQPRRIRRDSLSLADSIAADNSDLAPQSGVRVKDLCEAERTKLIADICVLIREGRLTDDMREKGLALIGKLARRMPGEPAHALGVEEAREEQTRRRLRR